MLQCGWGWRTLRWNEPIRKWQAPRDSTYTGSLERPQSWTQSTVLVWGRWVGGMEGELFSRDRVSVLQDDCTAVWMYLMPLNCPLKNEEDGTFYAIYSFCACMPSCFSHVWLFVTLWEHSSPDSSAHGILQARVLEWVAMPSSRGSSQPRVWTRVCLLNWQADFLYHLCHWGSPCVFYPNFEKERNRPGMLS